MFLNKKNALLGLLLALFAILSCDEAAIRETKKYTEEDVNMEVGQKVEILYSDSARVRVRVTAPLLHYFSDRDNPHQHFPNGIKVDFFEKDQSIRSTLVAKSADRYELKGVIEVRDSVVLTTVKNEKLETAELTWNEKEEKVYTDKFVKITQPGEVIYGYGLEANQDFSYWKLKVPKGRIKVKE